MKLISVPKTPDAMQRLDFDECKSEELLEVDLGQDEFDALWDSGIFAELNEKIGLLIDDYEEESITQLSQLRHAQAIVALALTQDDQPSSMSALKQQIDKAIEFKTGVFFFF